MQPTLCSRCQKNLAVLFITKIENGESRNEGLCLKCAKELGLKPVDDLMRRMGISDDDLETLTNEMMSAFGGAEGMEGLMESMNSEPDQDDEGRTATFPFLNKLFGGAGAPAPNGEQSGKKNEKDPKGDVKNGKRKFLENYCICLTPA